MLRHASAWEVVRVGFRLAAFCGNRSCFHASSTMLPLSVEFVSHVVVSLVAREATVDPGTLTMPGES